jgi:hypothetical protein
MGSRASSALCLFPLIIQATKRFIDETLLAASPPPAPLRDD